MKIKEVPKGFWEGIYICALYTPPIEKVDVDSMIDDKVDYGNVSLQLYKKWYDEINSNLYLQVNGDAVIKFYCAPLTLRKDCIEEFESFVYDKSKKYPNQINSPVFYVSDDKKSVCCKSKSHDMVDYQIFEYDDVMKFLN